MAMLGCDEYGDYLMTSLAWPLMEEMLTMAPDSCRSIMAPAARQQRKVPVSVTWGDNQ